MAKAFLWHGNSLVFCLKIPVAVTLILFYNTEKYSLALRKKKKKKMEMHSGRLTVKQNSSNRNADHCAKDVW